MSLSSNLALPFIEAAQAQKHVTHNEALRVLDTLVQLAVLDRDLAAPPASPVEGQRWIIAASPTGAWSGHAGHVAAWQDGGWQFSVPKTGWTAFVVDESLLVTWNGSAWVNALGEFISALQNLTLLGVGTTADSTNPFSAKLNNALWVAKTVAEGGTGDLRTKLSKEAAAKTLSLLLQTNFSSRAEIGLTGDDDFRITVSADGTAWVDALLIDRATGLLTHADGTIARTLSVQRNGSTNSSATGSGGYVEHTPAYTMPANFLNQGRVLRITAHFRVSTGSTVPQLDIQLKAGTVVLAHFTPNAVTANSVNNQYALQWILQAIDGQGAAANVEVVMLGNSNSAGSVMVHSDTDMPVALATNVALSLKVVTQWANAGMGTNTMTLSQLIVEALN